MHLYLFVGFVTIYIFLSEGNNNNGGRKGECIKFSHVKAIVRKERGEGVTREKENRGIRNKNEERGAKVKRKNKYGGIKGE